jgi:hypothetical protein
MGAPAVDPDRRSFAIATECRTIITGLNQHLLRGLTCGRQRHNLSHVALDALDVLGRAICGMNVLPGSLVRWG